MAVIVAAFVASLLALISSPAGAAVSVTPTTVSGVDRYATSAKAATTAYSGGTNNVVLVGGAN